MKNPRLYTRKLRSINALRRESFSRAMAHDGGAVFDKDFFQGIQKQRANTSKLSLKLAAAQFPLIALLLFSLIPIKAQVTIIGITPEASRNLREILIVVSALLGVVVALINVNKAVLTDMVAAYAERLSKGKKETVEYLKVGFGVDWVTMPDFLYGNLLFGWGYSLFLGTLVTLGAIIFLLVLIAAAVIHFFILRDIYYDPSFSQGVSIAVIVFVLMCDVLNVCLSVVQTGLLGMRDFGNMIALTKIGETRPERATAVYQDMARKFYRRPWIVRLFTRPKMPKRLPD